jgi:hypothetical protein
MEEPAPISREEAEFASLLATALERERQRLREEQVARDSPRSAISKGPD